MMMMAVSSWAALRGDVDGNGMVDVADVNAVINAMLGKGTGSLSPSACDINGDGMVDISDVNLVIDIMLGRATTMCGTRPRFPRSTSR